MCLSLLKYQKGNLTGTRSSKQGVCLLLRMCAHGSVYVHTQFCASMSVLGSLWGSEKCA